MNSQPPKSVLKEGFNWPDFNNPARYGLRITAQPLKFNEKLRKEVQEVSVRG